MGEIADLEKTLAGVILQKPEIYPEISDKVFPTDFGDPRAAKVFSFAGEAFTTGQGFDIIIAATKMPNDARWLAEAVDVIPINYIDYAVKINSYARARRIRAGVRHFMDKKIVDPEIMLYELESISRSESKKELKSAAINNVVARTLEIISENKRRGKRNGVDTGFDFMREMYIRYIPGQMWVITGFTSAGKSAMANEMMGRIGEARIVLISTEMTESQVVSRMIARKTEVHNQVILSGVVDDYKQDDVDLEFKKLRSRNLAVYDNIIDIKSIESVVMQHAMKSGVDVVFIDYVQQLVCAGTSLRDRPVEIANRIQQLAKRAKTCIICMSQISNEVGRGVTDQFEAKGAGEWAANCDVGIQLKRKKSDKYKLLLDMKKGRHFGTTRQEFEFKGNFTRIEEVAQKF